MIVVDPEPYDGIIVWFAVQLSPTVTAVPLWTPSVKYSVDANVKVPVAINTMVVNTVAIIFLNNRLLNVIIFNPFFPCLKCFIIFSSFIYYN